MKARAASTLWSDHDPADALLLRVDPASGELLGLSEAIGAGNGLRCDPVTASRVLGAEIRTSWVDAGLSSGLTEGASRRSATTDHKETR